MKVTRGMQRRTAKLARRSEIVTGQTLVAGIDLAKRESVVVFVRASDKARLGYLRIGPGEAGVRQVLHHGEALVSAHGLSGLVVAMEATGNLWKIASRACTNLEIEYVIVQSFVLSRAREFDDLTRDKTDRRDAGLIADLAADRRFTDVKLERGPWAQLRMYADARDHQRVRRSADLQEQRALLELVWPELLERLPDLQGAHLQAALRLGLSPLEIASMTMARFIRQLRREQRECRFLELVARRIWEAAGEATPCDELDAAVLRCQCAAQRVLAADRAIATYEQRLLSTFQATGLGWMQGQIRGLGDAALASIMGLAGDLRRLDDGGCIVKLAGSNPTERSSGDTVVHGGIHRRGRPTLRTLAWQAATNLIRHNADFRDRYRALTTREHRPLRKRQAQLAVANKLLRILWAMAVSGQPYSSELATRGRMHDEVAA
jgi:transposase